MYACVDGDTAVIASNEIIVCDVVAAVVVVDSVCMYDVAEYDSC